jgi:isoleucyl-tRNA synthetase
MVNRIQNIRKENGYELTDRILVTIGDNEALRVALIEFKDYICREILADSLEFVPVIENGTTIEINDVPLTISINKINN